MEKFNRLTILERLPNRKVRCLCDCGKETVTRLDRVKSGKTKSCGCYAVQVVKIRMTTHGMHDAPGYNNWYTMLQRCKKEGYGYKENNITVCERWYDVSNFIEDMGIKPGRNYTIERIDNTKGYTPDNCRWATYAEQSRNKKNNVWVEIEGRRIVLTDFAKEIDMYPATLRQLLNKHSPSFIKENRETKFKHFSKVKQQ